MKRAILLLLAFTFCGMYGMKTVQATIPPEVEEIQLRGKLDLNAGPNDIEAYVDGHYVYLEFHRDFGNVSITLYDPNGLTLYNDVVNTSVQQLVVIPVTAFVDGTYTIVLENAFGYADGEFEKQP